MDNLTYKPPFRDGAVFENGERVLTTAPSDALSSSEQTLESLIEFWGPCPDPARALEIIESDRDKAGDDRSVEFLARLFGRLRGAKGRQVQMALLADVEWNFQTEADAMGITRQTLHTNIARLRKRFGFEKTSDEAPSAESLN